MMDEMRAVIAALAMNGLLSGQTNRHANDVIQDQNETYAEDVARDAVIHADALIRALEEKP